MFFAPCLAVYSRSKFDAIALRREPYAGASARAHTHGRARTPVNAFSDRLALNLSVSILS